MHLSIIYICCVHFDFFGVSFSVLLTLLLILQGQDEGNRMDEDEDEGMEVFTKRKLESNWDRYKESEKEEPSDDTPTQRGTDYHVLLESAGKEYMRFSLEMAWPVWF